MYLPSDYRTWGRGSFAVDSRENRIGDYQSGNFVYLANAIIRRINMTKHSSLTFLTLLVIILAGCETTPRPRLPTDAEIEQYNAQVPHEAQIVCMEDVELGSRFPRRVCYRVGYLEDQAKQGQAVVDGLRADGLLDNPLHFPF